VRIDLPDRSSFGLERVQVVPLMLKTPLLEDVDDRIHIVGTLHQTTERSALERSQVLARKETDEVRGGKDRLTVDCLHGAASCDPRPSAKDGHGLHQPVADFPVPKGYPAWRLVSGIGSKSRPTVALRLPRAAVGHDLRTR